MTVAITTPTGNVGRHVVRLVVQAGLRPRVLLRHPSALPSDVREYVDAVRVDQLDANSVVEATEGVDALYWVDPPTSLPDPLDGYRLATESLVAAVRTNGIRRVVFQSSGGAERRRGMGDIDGLALTETALDELGIDVTHLRCGYFLTNLLFDLDSILGGTLTTAMDVDRPLPWVAPEDIAAVATARLLSSDWHGRHVQAVHGPEDLSFREVAAVLGEVLDRSVTVRQVSDDDVRAELEGAGLTPQQVAAIVDMTAGIRDGFVPENPRDYTTTTPTPLAGWARTRLKAACDA
ncbi:NmrA family NAD(P)-binding protein [Rhodococcus rhodochrous]|uniref:NmrA family NAD(P)-binding protein n=1 Tax=Rhodococcus rhodochrous TaxID=1829 RepID=UPI000D05E677|nr:NAD(P)H-binding protein [Rhodococcus rhodochrous]AYA25496.1 NmrA family transcriptional regulator [Rhodococcus rhodochrous]